MKKQNMIFRLKLEITELVSEMVGKLPESLFISDSTIFLDPSMGGGQFVQAIESRLRKHGHSDSNIKNRVFGIEKSLLRVNYAVNSRKLVGSYTVDNKDIPDIFMKMKFDAIVGNPPFQAVMEDGKRSAKNHNLWSEFIHFAFSSLKDDGYLGYITPKGWMSSTSNVKKYFLDKKVLHISVDTINKYFPGVGSKFSYYIIQNSNNDGHSTSVECLNEKEVVKSNINIDKKIHCFPSLLTDTSLSIFNKFFDNAPFEVRCDSELHKFTKKEFISDKQTDHFKYTLVHTPSQIVFSNKKHSNHDHWKVMIPLTTYYESILVKNDCGTTQAIMYIICKNQKEANRIKNILLKKIYRFVANNTRWANFNTPEVIKKFPKVDLTKEWTDAELYTYFKLTNEEIKLIEQSVKD